MNYGRRRVRRVRRGGIDLNIPYVPPVSEIHQSQEQPRSENMPLEAIRVGGTQVQGHATDQSHGHSQIGDGAIVIDEEVAIVSAEMFAEARNRSRRIRQDVRESEIQGSSRTDNDSFSHRVTSPNRAVGAKGTDIAETSRQPSDDRKFICTICLGPLTEETTTRCGHIFCQKCIQDALAVDSRCPTCRRKIRKNGIHRIYFPKLE